MRCEILKKHKSEIQVYCANNGLSYNKLVSSSLSWSEENVFVLYNSHNPQREKMGLLDDIPMPLVLEIYLENGKLRFVQTDITHKYLGVDSEAGPAATMGFKNTPRPWSPDRERVASRTRHRELVDV